MTQYLDLLSRILMEGTQHKHSKFQGDIILGDGGCRSNDNFQTFHFNGKPVRGKLINGEPWLVGRDVALVLGYSKPRNALSTHVDDKDKSTALIQGPAYQTRAIIINESGTYALVFSSKLKEAKAFRRWVTKEVLPSIRRTGGYGIQQGLPDFLQRLMLNIGQVPNTHFSVIAELFATVYGAFEQAGHRLSDKAANGVKLRPDISVGRCFSIWLRKNGYNAEEGRITYKHKFPEGYEVDAYAYPNGMLGVFRDYVYQEWLPNQAPKYLKGKDDKALTFLPKLLGNKAA